MPPPLPGSLGFIMAALWSRRLPWVISIPLATLARVLLRHMLALYASVAWEKWSRHCSSTIRAIFVGTLARCLVIVPY